ncbi:MetQ/NlpA family ABC transporter substrate-binding protein [Arthrobacter sp. ISL-69]|uniref:MetQ/NlpA family ABC transporter substrate-binding protein n=1 Tax=Arthrobacter sp. ISL-69 TaxID=2819113 RepID=UPI001BE794EF|nr:MetQ/NlpA family ABC transporter substrate-binding protein [Arthrobacter sp. ISL-69]MBT2536706.1 ATP-binding cassette domain-containing protein [Arthrobacter sp. ISL-69]
MISVDRVSKSYGSGEAAVRALDDVSLTVGRGEIFGVVGQSGAGKSTLIRTINSLERPDSGSATVDGRDVTSLLSKFTEIENASLPQALNDKDAAIVTLAFALPAGLSADEQLLVEGKDSAYYNVLAVKAEMKDDPRVQKLFKILTSQEMKDFINTKFKGLVIPAS